MQASTWQSAPRHLGKPSRCCQVLEVETRNCLFLKIFRKLSRLWKLTFTPTTWSNTFRECIEKSTTGSGAISACEKDLWVRADSIACRCIVDHNRRLLRVPAFAFTAAHIGDKVCANSAKMSPQHWSLGSMSWSELVDSVDDLVFCDKFDAEQNHPEYPLQEKGN